MRRSKLATILGDVKMEDDAKLDLDTLSPERIAELLHEGREARAILSERIDEMRSQELSPAEQRIQRLEARVDRFERMFRLLYQCQICAGTGRCVGQPDLTVRDCSFCTGTGLDRAGRAAFGKEDEDDDDRT